MIFEKNYLGQPIILETLSGLIRTSDNVLLFFKKKVLSTLPINFLLISNSLAFKWAL